MAFLKRALRTAENFLEQVDESVVRASQHLSIDQSPDLLTGDPAYSDHPPPRPLRADNDNDGDDERSDAWARVGVCNIVSAVDRLPSSGDSDDPPARLEGLLADAQNTSSNLRAADSNGDAKTLRQGESAAAIPPLIRAYIRASREEISELRAELSVAERELATLGRAVEVMQAQVHDADGAVHDVRELDVQLRRSKDAHRAAMSDAARWQQSAQQAEVERDELRLRIPVLQEELAAVQRHVKTVGERGSEDVGSLRREAMEAALAQEREVAAHAETRLLLQRRVEELESENASHADAIADAERRASEARAKMQRAERLHVEARRSLDAARQRVNELEDLSSEATSFRKANAELEGIVSAQEARQEALESELERRASEVRAAQVEVVACREEVERERTLREREHDRSKSAEEVDMQLRSLANTTMRTQSEVELMRGENRALKLQLETERRRNREIQAIAASRGNVHAYGDLERGVTRTGARGRNAAAAAGGGMTLLKPPVTWPAPVRRVLELLDAFSCTAVATLRREPLLRIGLGLYIIFVHIVIYLSLHHATTQTAGASRPVLSAPLGRAPSTATDGLPPLSRAPPADPAALAH